LHVSSTISEYDDTIRFAKLGESDTVSEEVSDNGIGHPGGVSYVPKVGDYVQWEPKGVLQFPEPKRVSGISGDGKFAFVDGSPTGLPISELKEEKAPVPLIPPPNLGMVEYRAAMSPNKRMQEDVFSLSEGRASFQWPTPLSKDSIEDLKDWLKILERKISRSVETVKPDETGL
jgi:hypothetical protein